MFKRINILVASTLILPIIYSTCFSLTINIPSERFSTITDALKAVKKGDTVMVGPGIYREHIILNPGITVISKQPLKAILDGNGRGTLVTLSTNASISGFKIRNGTFGVSSTSSGTSITKCKIYYHQQSGIMCTGNLPKIEDNIIIYNRGSGVQGWDVRSTNASISHNTIACNANHGISFGGNSTVVIENNIIAYNEQFGLKPVDDISNIQLLNNNFYQNVKTGNVLPETNQSINPVFINEKALNFSLSKDSPCIGKGSDSTDLGARIVY